MKPTLRSFFSGGPASREGFGRGFQREELRQRGKRGRSAERMQKRASRRSPRKHRTHYGGGDHVFIALFRRWRASAAGRARPLGRAATGRHGGHRHSHSLPGSGRTDCRKCSCPSPRCCRDLCRLDQLFSLGFAFPVPEHPTAGVHGVAVSAGTIRRPPVQISPTRPRPPRRKRPYKEAPPRSAATDRATTRSRSRNRD